MSKIIFVPVERLEQRYTGMVYDLLAPHCDVEVDPNFKQPLIKKGQFLDICGTISYKSWQLNQIAFMFDHDDIQDGDVFLIGDIFFPGIESIKYMAELLGISVKIVAFNHAGRSDETDFVRRLGSWADSSEQGWHDACDLILVGSEFHRKRVISYFKLPEYKVKNTGMPWCPEWCNDILQRMPRKKKEPFVIWPHRISFEKGDDILFRYALQTSRRIVITSSGAKDKAWEQFAGMENVIYLPGISKLRYYQLLDEAEFYLSTARQETFGYTLQEALHYGCKVLAPNRACYNEFLPMCNLYDTEANLDMDFDCLAHTPTPYALENNVQIIMDAVKSVV